MRPDLPLPAGPAPAGDPSADLHFRERLEQRLAFEHLIAAISTDFINAQGNLDSMIEAALGRIGSLFEVDRAYVFRFDAGPAAMSNTHEWVAEGVSREAHNLQQVPVDTFPWLMAELVQGRDVHVPDTARLPDSAASERSEFLREGIRSLAVVPFGNAGAPEGFIGFDCVRQYREWSPEIMIGLRLVGQMIFNAFRARELSESLSQLAFHDPLTGLGNRRLLRERLGNLLDRHRRSDGMLAVLVIDLDDFKLVNDSFGHSLGDQLLKAVANRLSSTVRVGDTVVRLGGDEFVIVADVDSVERLSVLVERLFAALVEPVLAGSMRFSIRMSIGIALYPQDGADAEALLRQADTAMYSAKADGKHRFAFFSEEMTRSSRATLQLRQDLRAALERGEIIAHYQPRVELPSRRVLGFEALARWPHPQYGLLLPGDFLGLAEQAGQIGEIDLCVLRHALRELAAWREREPECRVSVNLSARDLKDSQLIGCMEACIRDAGDHAAGLEIEVTESSLITDIASASAALARLRDAAPGVTVAIDDFGSGYSSLAYLGRLPVSTLKIDRSFTADLDRDSHSARAIVQAILALSRNLGLRVVVEGVETEHQADILVDLGCNEAQGFLFAPALDAASAGALLGTSLQP